MALIKIKCCLSVQFTLCEPKTWTLQLYLKYRNSQHLLVLSLRTTYPAINQLTAVTVARAPMCRKGAVD